MKVTESPIPDLLIIEPAVYDDQRGYFFESYNRQKYHDNGITAEFVQDNQSSSVRGVLRGLHYQVGEMAQAKLVSATRGTVLDIAIDIRKGSPCYGKAFGLVLSEENKKQLFIPHGFAHGFLVLSETALFTYKCDNFYSKEHEDGIIYNDPQLNIDWQIDLAEAIVSDKDKQLPNFGETRYEFVYNGESTKA